MSGQQVMVIVIVAIVMVASIIRAGIRASTGLPQGKRARQAALEAAGRDDHETQRLREEVKTLKDRLAVIERITVEKENSLEREIGSLRDR